MVNKTLLLLCLSSTLYGVSFTDYGENWKSTLSSEAQQFLALKILQESLWDDTGETNKTAERTDISRVDTGIRVVLYPVENTSEYKGPYFSTIFGKFPLFPENSSICLEERTAAVSKLLKYTKADPIQSDDGCSPWIHKTVYKLLQVDPETPMPSSSKEQYKSLSDEHGTVYQQLTALDKLKAETRGLWESLNADYIASSGVFTKPE